MFSLLAQIQNLYIKNEPNELLEKYSLLFLGLSKDNLPFSRVNNSTLHAMTSSKPVLTVSRVRNVNETEVQGQAASACLDIQKKAQNTQCTSHDIFILRTAIFKDAEKLSWFPWPLYSQTLWEQKEHTDQTDSIDFPLIFMASEGWLIKLCGFTDRVTKIDTAVSSSLQHG